MKKRIIYLSLLSIATAWMPFNAQAQNEEDALRYSQNKLIGTARFTSMGGAFTALGGDHSAIGLNPASVGIYRKSEFSFSPSFYNTATSGRFNGNGSEEERLNLNAANLGYLANFYTGRVNWVSASLALGYNRTNNFNNELSYNGISPGSSLLGNYTATLNRNGGTPEADVFNENPFGAGLAYNAFLINPTTADSNLYDHVLQNSTNLYQEMNVNRSGGMGEYYLAFGGNFEDRFYMGGSINLTTLRYREETTYKEIPDVNDETNDLVEMRKYENLLTTGTGVNFKFGVIGRITNWLRMGASIHSPTYYSMTDNWSTQIDADYENGDQFREISPDGSFDYRLRTPARMMTGLGFVLGKRGIISAEYEYVDFSQAVLKTRRNELFVNEDFNLENRNIRSAYQSAGIIKAGTEWRFDPFRFRLGYNYRENTFDSSVNEDNSSSTYTVGAGIRMKGYYFDLGYSLTQFNQRYYAYPEVENPANFDTDAHTVVLTAGFRF